MEKEPKSNRDRETVNAAESFNYTNESNLDPRNNEFFVYHFEENKNRAGFEDNKHETGKEVNTDIDKATEIKTEDFSKVTKISKVATTTIQTVVATTTTTVVAVVAGGAAVAELSYIEPKYHEFSVVETVGNAVSYTLLLGDDLEVIQNEEDQQTRNVVIELKLDSFDKVVETTKVDKYGTVAGKFENLNYSCDYTITAYEYSFMDVAGWIPHQLDSKKFTTEPERNYGLVFERVIDEEQDPHFYVTLSYNDPNNYYSNFSLEFFLFSGEEESSIGSATLVTPYTDKQEIIMPSDFRDEDSYRVKVNCLSTDPRDGYQEDENGRGNPVPITLFSKEIEFSSIEQETLPVAKRDVEFDRVIDGYGQEHYYVTLTCDDEHNYYSNFTVETVSLDDGGVISSNNLSEPYTDRQEIIMPREFVGENTYRIDVKCLSTNPKHQPQGKYAPEGGSDGVTITLFSKEIAFADIPEEVEEPIETDTQTLTFRGEINSYDETLYYARLFYTDDVALEAVYFSILDSNEQQIGENFYLEYEQNETTDTQVDLPVEDMIVTATYTINVYKVVEDPDGSQTGASLAEPELWFTAELVLDDVPTSNVPYSDPTITFDKYKTADYQMEYKATLNVYDDPESKFYNYRIEFDDGEVDPFQIGLDAHYGQEQTIADSYNQIKEDSYYTVTVYRTIGQGNDAVDSELLTSHVKFSEIQGSEATITNNIFFYKTQRQNGEMLVEAMLTSPYEDDNYYSDFTLTLEWTPVGETQSDSREMRLTNAFRERQDLQGMDMNVEDWTYEMEVTVTCMSTNPEDTMTADAVEITFFQGTINFNELPVTQEPYVEPVFVGETFTKAKTYYDNFNGLYLTINATDPCDFWYYYEFQLYEDANHGTAVGDPQTLDKNQTVRLDNSDDADNPYNEIVNSEDTYYYEIKTLAYNSANPEEPEEIMLVDDGSICFNDLTPTLVSFAPYMVYTFTETGTDSSENTLYSLEGELVIADRERYTDYVLTWESFSGSYTKTYQCGDFAYPCDFDGTDDINSVLYGTFTVTLTATDTYTYSTVTLYREDLYIARGIIEKA